MKLEDYLNKTVNVKIDRPFGSKHPQYGFIYPVNYGFIPNTISGDGEELDCYILGVLEPLNEFTGKCIAIIHRINDDDDKLIVVPENMSFDIEEIEEHYGIEDSEKIKGKTKQSKENVTKEYK